MKQHTDPNRCPRTPPLPRRVRWAVRLAVGLPPLALLAATGVYCVSLGHVLRADLAPVAAGEVTRQIGHEVRLGAVRFTPGALVLDNVAVSDRRTFAGSGVGASVPRITIHYNLHDLLFDSGNAAHALGDIVLDRPTALAERYTQKTFNFTDVIDVFTKKPPRPHAKPFAGRILVRDGTLRARDFVAPANLGLRPANNTVTDVNVAVDFHLQNNVYFTGTGRGVDGRVTDVGLSGDASRKTPGRFRVFVHVADADAAYWSSYFAQASSVLQKATVVAGRADLDLTASRLTRTPAGLPIDLEGRVGVRHATVALHDPRFEKLPIQDVNGVATFTQSGVTIDGTLLGGRQPVRVSGTVFDFTNPQLAFAGSSPRLDAVRLARFFPQVHLPPGLGISPAPVTARVTGSSLNPVVEIQATLPAVTFRGNTATDVRTRVLYANNVFLFPDTTFRLSGGGQGAVRVTINSAPKTPTVRIGGRVLGVNLAALRLPPTAGKPLALGGLADVAFLADDQGQPLSVVANVSVARPRVARTVLRAAQGRVVYSEARGLTLSRVVVQAADGGVLTASGTVPLSAASPLNLAVNASGADLGRLLSPYAKLDVGGLAYAQARVSGPLSAPQVAGRVQLYGARYGRVATDLVTGTVSGGADAVRLQDVVVSRYPTAVRVSGTVSGLRSANPSLALTASLSRGYLSNLADIAKELAPLSAGGRKAAPTLAGLPDVSGLVSAQVRVTGRLKSPQVAARATASNVLVGDYRVQSAAADVSYAGGTVRVRDATLRTEDGATATAHGQFAPATGRLRAAFAGTRIDLDQYDFLIQPYADVDGLLNVSGQVGGTLKLPVIGATVTANGLTVEGQNFAPFSIGARYADGVLTKTGGPTEFSLLTPGAAGARYVVDALRVSLPTPARPDAPRTLALSAHIPETSPENLKHLADALRASRFRGTQAGQSLLAQIDALPAAPQGTVWVPSLSVRGPFTAPAVRATIGAHDLSIADNRIGALTARLAYTGGPDPAAHADVSTTDIRAAGVPLQTVSLLGDFAHRVVTVDRLDARSAEAFLHGQGRADLDGTVSANLDASNVPLSLFNLFLPVRERLSGRIGALTVVASGRTQAPDLTASVDLDQPAVTVTGPAVAGESSTETRYAIDSVRSSKITLSAPDGPSGARVLAVSGLSAFKAGRPIVTLSGTLPIAAPAAPGGQAVAAVAGFLPGVPGDQPLHADLQVADLSALALFAPALIDPKRTGGALSASVDYGGPGGTGAAPRLLGQVNIANGSLGLNGFDTGLTAVNGRVLVQNDRLSVPSFTLKSTKGGTLTLSGGGALPLPGGDEGRAALRLSAAGLRIDESGKGNFLAKTYNTGARGQVDGSVSITGPWTAPLVATPPDAPLVVSNALGTLSTGATPALAARTVPAVDPRFNVAVLLGARGRTISVRGPFLTAEANGDLELTGRVSAPVLRAHVNVARGQFLLPPTTRLAIVKPDDGTGNTVDVRYPAPASDPTNADGPALETRVHLVARSSVSVSSASLAANQSVVGNVIGQSAPQTFSNSLDQTFGRQGSRYTITATITGLLNSTDPNEPQIALMSDPGGLNRQQMLAALVPEGALQGILGGGQGAESAFKQGLQEAFSSVGVPALLSPFEAGLAGALGLEDFSVDYAPDAPVNVTVSKQIAPRLLLTYIQAVGSHTASTTSGTAGTTNNVAVPSEYTVKLGYGLTRHLQVSVSTDDQRNDTLALESVFNF